MSCRPRLHAHNMPPCDAAAARVRSEANLLESRVGALASCTVRVTRRHVVGTGLEHVARVTARRVVPGCISATAEARHPDLERAIAIAFVLLVDRFSVRAASGDTMIPGRVLRVHTEGAGCGFAADDGESFDLYCAEDNAASPLTALHIGDRVWWYAQGRDRGALTWTVRRTTRALAMRRAGAPARAAHLEAAS